MSAPEQSPRNVPEPSAELILLRVCIEAFLATQSRKRGERFLHTVAERLAAEANLAAVFHIRTSGQSPTYRQARTKATQLFEQCLPVLLASLPEE